MEGSEDGREPKSGKPPYLFLIPVAVGVLGFIGYQTVRLASDTHPSATLSAADTFQAQAVVRNGVITVRPNDQSAKRVAVVHPETSPSASPAPSATPTVAPSPKAAPKSADKLIGREKATHKASAEHEQTLTPTTVAQVSERHGGTMLDARTASTLTRSTTAGAPAAPAEQASAPPVTDAPIVQSASPGAATAKPVQVAVAPPPPAATTSIDASDHIVEAKMSYAAAPDYPDIAREEGARGTSIVYVTVNEKGGVTHMSIASSSGNAALDRAALAAARSSRYVPPKVDGKAATETYRVVYDFSP